VVGAPVFNPLPPGTGGACPKAGVARRAPAGIVKAEPGAGAGPGASLIHTYGQIRQC